jgi:hypothetical protein
MRIVGDQKTPVQIKPGADANPNIANDATGRFSVSRQGCIAAWCIVSQGMLHDDGVGLCASVYVSAVDWKTLA